LVVSASDATELLELAEAAFNEQHDLGPHGIATGNLPATQARRQRGTLSYRQFDA
jgi:hypothetical protein